RLGRPGAKLHFAGTDEGAMTDHGAFRLAGAAGGEDDQAGILRRHGAGTRIERRLRDSGTGFEEPVEGNDAAAARRLLVEAYRAHALRQPGGPGSVVPPFDF